MDRFGDQFEQLLLDAIGNPTLALELLRQLTICSRSSRLGRAVLRDVVDIDIDVDRIVERHREAERDRADVAFGVASHRKGLRHPGTA